MGHSNFGINLRNINQANLQWNKFFPYFKSFGISLVLKLQWHWLLLVIIVASASEASSTPTISGIFENALL